MYVVTSIPFVSRTRATFLKAELGFFGVEMKTRIHTPRFWGHPCKAGLSVFMLIFFRPFRTSWLIVGNLVSSAKSFKSLKITMQGRHQPCIEHNLTSLPEIGHQCQANLLRLFAGNRAPELTAPSLDYILVIFFAKLITEQLRLSLRQLSLGNNDLAMLL